MRKVSLVVGPRGAGKSSFCEKVAAIDPSITLISRDKMCMELFGKTSFSPYTGEHQFANDRLWEAITEHLSSSADIKVILDKWNGSPRERDLVQTRLRSLGVDEVDAWYFTTPVECVEEWFWKKPDVAKIGEMRARKGQGFTFYLEDSPRREYELFHKFALDIDQEHFDKVVRINPLTMLPVEVLGSQAGPT